MNEAHSASRFLTIIVVSCSMILIISLLCDCGMTPIRQGIDDSHLRIAADGDNESFAITIEGYAVNDERMRVSGDMLATLMNNATSESISEEFDHGRFEIEVDVPEWAALDDELYINITSEDEMRYFGSMTFTLNETDYYVNETARHIEIFIENPPTNYNKLYILILIIALGFVFALWVVFTHLMLSKLVIRRAGQIKIEEWKRRGGGNYDR